MSGNLPTGQNSTDRPLNRWSKGLGSHRPGWPKRVPCLNCSRWLTSPGPHVRLCEGCRGRDVELSAHEIDTGRRRGPPPRA
jgi:hypothetical protein